MARLEGKPLMALLRSLDDPAHIEWPRGFEKRREAQRFAKLVKELDRVFECTCTTDGHVEDASYHDQLVVPGSATASHVDLAIRASNFGNMAVVCLERPGAYDGAETSTSIDPRDRDRCERALHELGYVVVAEESLWNRYDGAYAGVNRPATWWTRFFDYL